MGGNDEIGDEGAGATLDGGQAATAAGSAGRGSRQWRSLWRIHFYSGIFAIPFMIFMALTGLVILYTQPIEDLTQGDIRTVDPQDTAFVSLDEQAAAVEAADPEGTVYDVTARRSPNSACTGSGRSTKGWTRSSRCTWAPSSAWRTASS